MFCFSCYPFSALSCYLIVFTCIMTEPPDSYTEILFCSITVNCTVSVQLISVSTLLTLNLDLSHQTGACCWANILCIRLAGSCARHVACVEFQLLTHRPSLVPAWSPWSPRAPLWSCQVSLKVCMGCTWALKATPVTNHSEWFCIEVIYFPYLIYNLF